MLLSRNCCFFSSQNTKTYFISTILVLANVIKTRLLLLDFYLLSITVSLWQNMSILRCSNTILLLAIRKLWIQGLKWQEKGWKLCYLSNTKREISNCYLWKYWDRSGCTHLVFITLIVVHLLSSTVIQHSLNMKTCLSKEIINYSSHVDTVNLYSAIYNSKQLKK